MFKEKAQRLGCEPSFKRDTNPIAQVVSWNKETSEKAVAAGQTLEKSTST